MRSKATPTGRNAVQPRGAARAKRRGRSHIGKRAARSILLPEMVPGGKVVWIVGAGFSKALGGPLLDDLFIPETLGNLRDRFRFDHTLFPLLYNVGMAPHLECLIWVYNYGRRFPYGKMALKGKTPHWPGERLWDDVEEYLVILDAAAQSIPAAAATPALLGPRDDAIARLKPTVEKFLHHTGYEGLASNPKEGLTIRDVIQILSDLARRVMAAQCSAFMLGAQVESEQWQPYADWVRECLDANHTVVSFNYDFAVERVAKDKIAVLTSNTEAVPEGKARLLKLHGSVSWLKMANEERVNPTSSQQYGEWAALSVSDARLMLLGTPGGSKRALTDTVLKGLWVLAEAAIREADAIVFLGYRFPPSDSDARSKILQAILDNRGRPYLALHSVLGPDTQRPDARRLRALLSATVGERQQMPNLLFAQGTPTPRDPSDRYFNLRSHPMWAQDFLSLASRTSIVGSSRAMSQSTSATATSASRSARAARTPSAT